MRRRLVLLGAMLLAAGAGGGVLASAEGGGGGATARLTPVTRHAAIAGAAATRRHPQRSRPHPAGSAASPRVNVLATEPASASRCRQLPPPASEHLITHRRWLRRVVITEYYPAPERWFTGRRVVAPGLPGRHAVDWLYSARGLAMEGDGIDGGGHPAHIAALGSTGWVNLAGRPTVPVCLGKWSDGPPAWLKGGWRNGLGQVTFPLEGGGWANGTGGRTRGYGGVTFASGSSLPIRFYHSIAVDPRLIPMGSRVYIPAYRAVNGGWFVAQDTGGAIRGPHVDVYRPPPPSPNDLGRYMTAQRILVVPPA